MDSTIEGVSPIPRRAADSPVNRIGNGSKRSLPTVQLHAPLANNTTAQQKHSPTVGGTTGAVLRPLKSATSSSTRINGSLSSRVRTQEDMPQSSLHVSNHSTNPELSSPPSTTNTTSLQALMDAADTFTSVSCEAMEIQERQKRKDERAIESLVGCRNAISSTSRQPRQDGGVSPSQLKKQPNHMSSRISVALRSTAPRGRRVELLTEQMDDVTLIDTRVADTMSRISQLLNYDDDDYVVISTSSMIQRAQQPRAKGGRGTATSPSPQPSLKGADAKERLEHQRLQKQLVAKMKEIERYKTIINNRKEDERRRKNLDHLGGTVEGSDTPAWLQMQRDANSDTRTTQSVIAEWQSRVNAKNKNAKAALPPPVPGEHRPKLHAEVERERQARVEKRDVLLHEGRLEAKGRMFYSGLEKVYDVATVTGHPLNLPRRKETIPTSSTTEIAHRPTTLKSPIRSQFGKTHLLPPLRPVEEVSPTTTSQQRFTTTQPGTTLSYMLNNFTKEELAELEEASINKPAAIESIRKLFRQIANESADRQEAKENALAGIVSVASAPGGPSPNEGKASPRNNKMAKQEDEGSECMAFSSLSDSSDTPNDQHPTTVSTNKKTSQENEVLQRQRAERRTEAKRLRKAARAKPFPAGGGVALGTFLESERKREARRERDRTLVKGAKKLRRGSSQKVRGGGSRSGSEGGHMGRASNSMNASFRDMENSNPSLSLSTDQHPLQQQPLKDFTSTRKYWRFLRSGKAVEVYYQPKLSAVIKRIIYPPAAGSVGGGGLSEAEALETLLSKVALTPQQLADRGLFLELERRVVPFVVHQPTSLMSQDDEDHMPVMTSNPTGALPNHSTAHNTNAPSGNTHRPPPSSSWIRIEEDGWVPVELVVPTGVASSPFAIVRTLTSVTLKPLYNLSSAAILQTVVDEVWERVAKVLRDCPRDLLETPPSDELDTDENDDDDNVEIGQSRASRHQAAARIADRRRRRLAAEQVRVRVELAEQRRRDAIRMMASNTRHEAIAALDPTYSSGIDRGSVDVNNPSSFNDKRRRKSSIHLTHAESVHMSSRRGGGALVESESSSMSSSLNELHGS